MEVLTLPVRKTSTCLTLLGAASERRRRHDHYLEGTLYCGTCESRRQLDNAKNEQGIRYAYYVCSGRATSRKQCARKAVPVGVADIDRRLEIEHGRHEGPRKHLGTALRLLVDCGQMYTRTDDHGRRLANQTFYDRIDIPPHAGGAPNEDERATIRLAEPFAALTPELTSTDVRCSSTPSVVETLGTYSNLGEGKIPVLALISDAERCQEPAANRHVR